MLLSLIGKRLLEGLATLWVVVTVTFFLLRLMPGGPFDQERALPPEVQANLNAHFHLDASLWQQYGYYLGGVLQGNLGPSYKYLSRGINDIVAEGFWISGGLGALAMAVGVPIGVALGTLAALTRRPSIDQALSVVGMVGMSLPTFITGGLMVLVFSLWGHLLPAATLQTPAHWVLPVLTLATVPFAYTFLLTRTAVYQVKTQLFPQMKRVYGIGEFQIATAHILRNALLPLVAILGPLAASILTGSFAVEYIYAIPGLGKHFITAVSNRDYTLVMGITIVYGVLLIVLNTVTDMVTVWLDPRLRQSVKA
jgi:oligopeptide transport system permease protein